MLLHRSIFVKMKSRLCLGAGNEENYLKPLEGASITRVGDRALRVAVPRRPP
jgi:hypothetical protein